ncbi:hypothetical protein DSO57_1033056 [Entomophthora muscae]|uniref:Uncharacterized protein n=1 Tax=Entomophthora muscae TaxID=34485 RepID=A0ACC2TYS0_9FUNG|nr:hypothetical protein DSO57_1033056 [Entomophthora muscae]
MKLLTLAVAVLADYDYIVVGSGPGGGTLATELALKGFKTLLIEAGPRYFQANQSTPAFQARASEDPATTFDFNVKHYDNNARYFYPRAGVLGGCSIHNAMISVYPNARDFKLMQTITGDEAWSEPNMRKYFKRMERNQYTTSQNHGYGGWLSTSYINFLRQLRLDANLLDFLAAVIGGIFYDLNGKDRNGLNTDKEANVFVPQAVDTARYTRANFQKYMRNVESKTRLDIWTNTFVTKVLFKGKVAVGVEYRKGRYLYKASPLSTDANRRRASKGSVMASEVIISAGTFNTPQLLMLSGIGPKEHLESFNIPVVADVAGVGRNMMDRYEIPIVIQYQAKFNLLKACKFTPTEEDPCYREFIQTSTGPYTSNGVVSGKLVKSNKSLREPDLFILNALSDFHGYYRGYSKNLARRLDSSTRLILKAHTSNTNGQVKLQSNDPFDVPDINFHSFSDGDRDLNILVNALKNERNFLKRNILVKYKELHPGPRIKTNQQIRSYIKDTAWGHHACCTAKMGTPDDPDAVVDAKFRVRGIKNLRVVDMSIFPKIPGYFPAVYLHMMAMKAADDIAPPPTPKPKRTRPKPSSRLWR